MTAGQLPVDDWLDLARAIRRRAFALSNAAGPGTARGWQAQRQSVLASIEALSGLKGNDAVLAADLWNMDVKPVLDMAHASLNEQLPKSVREAADEFTKYTGKTLRDPTLAQAVVQRGREAILHDWDKFEVGTQRLIASQIQEGVLAGHGNRVIARNLAQKVPQLTRARASTIARTELAAAQDEMSLQTMRRLGVQDWTWKARSDACPICFLLHGTTFTAEETSGRHPNCRCVMVPKVAGVKPPKPNRLKDINDKLPKRLQSKVNAAGNPTISRNAFFRRLMVQDNPKWKPTWRLARPGTTKFKKPSAPQWKPAGPDIAPKLKLPAGTPAPSGIPGTPTAPKGTPGEWLGKPAPVQPVAPTATEGTNAVFDTWLNDVKKRYSDFAKAKGGAAHTELHQSNNWDSVYKVVQGAPDAEDGIKLLLKEHYIDDVLEKEAKRLLKLRRHGTPAQQRAFKLAFEKHEKALAAWEKNRKAWADANGIKATLQGMDNPGGHGTVPVSWADAELPVAKGKARAALKQYTGSTYDEWNTATRKLKSQTELPGGRFKQMTIDADKGFAPAPDSFVVKRGTGWAEFTDRNGVRMRNVPPSDPGDMVGQVMEWDSYVSTSVADKAAFPRSVEMVIRVPKDSQVAYARPYSGFKYENEVILKRGQRFFVHAVYDSKGRTMVEVEILPDGVSVADYVGLVPKPAASRYVWQSKTPT